MNNQLTLDEIISNLKSAESAHIIPSKETVKLSLRSQTPTAKDFYSKLVYDRIRNKRNPLFKKPERLLAGKLMKIEEK